MNDELNRLITTLEANSATQATLSADIRASVEESRVSRTTMEAATVELREVIAVGKDRIKVADERRAQANRAEEARIGALQRVGQGVWKAAAPAATTVLMALAVYIAAQYLGVHVPTAESSPATTVDVQVGSAQ